MAPPISLLSKAVQALNDSHSNNDIQDSIEEQICESLPDLKLTNPFLGRFELLGILTSPFSLNQDEEFQILQIFTNCKLAPTLSLFDLLFFDLYQVISSFRPFVRAEDLDKLIVNLEICYATLAEASLRDVSGIQQFLNTLMGQLLSSIKEKFQLSSNSPKEIKMKYASDCRYILTTLNPKVKLICKFLENTASHSLFFDHAFEKIKGCEEVLILGKREVKTTFENNCLFLQTIFRSAGRINSRLNAFQTLLFSFAEKLKEASSIGAMCSLIDEDIVNVIQQSKTLQTVVSSCLAGVLKIGDQLDKMSEKTLTNGVELMVLQGTLSHKIHAKKSDIDSHDILADFKSENLIPQAFQLTESESSLVQDLFKQYPLNSNLTMLELLGFVLYDRLGKLKELTQFSLHAQLAKTQNMAFTFTHLLFVGMNRSLPASIVAVGSINDASHRFALFHNTFDKKLDELLNGFVSTIRNRNMLSNASNKARDKIAATNQLIFDTIDKTIKPLRDLWMKLLSSQGSHELMLKSLSYYQGASQLDNEHPQGKSILTQYWEYVKKGSIFALNMKYISRVPDFEEAAKALLLSSPPKSQEMGLLGKELTKHIYSLNREAKKAKKKLRKAMEGELTYQGWLAEKNIRGGTPKTQPEFIEQLFGTFTSTIIFQGFFSDMLEMIECRLFPKGTLTTKSCFFRLHYNVYRNQKEESFQSSPSLLPVGIHEKTLLILNPIQLYFASSPFQKLIQLLNDDYFFPSGSFDYSRCLEFLSPLQDDINKLFNNALTFLSNLPKALLDEIRRHLLTRPLEELISSYKSEIKEAIFLEGIQLMRPLLILSDMLALLQERRFTEEASIIPSELANIMELDGIDELFEQIIQAKTPILKELPPKELAKAAELLKVKSQQPPPAKSTIFAPSPHKASSKISSNNPNACFFFPREIANLKKSRQILSKLKEMGFFEDRSNGSHTILKSTQGGIVVVPNNPNLPRGTAGSIAKQTFEALQK